MRYLNSIHKICENKRFYISRNQFRTNVFVYQHRGDFRTYFLHPDHILTTGRINKAQCEISEVKLGKTNFQWK